MNKKRYIFIFLIMLWVYFIFSRSLCVADESLKESGFFSELFRKICDFIPWFGESMKENAINIVRKAAHVCEYAILGGLLCGFMNTFEDGIRKHIPWVLFIGLFTACFDEGIQAYVEGRGSLVSDVFIDLGGILLSLIVALFYMAIKCKKERRI